MDEGVGHLLDDLLAIARSEACDSTHRLASDSATVRRRTLEVIGYIR